jgi:hypothetical protein
MNRMKVIAAALGGLAVTVTIAACSATAQADPAPNVPVPAKLAAPAGNKLVATYPAKGVQVYQCTNNAWTLLEPAAILKQGKENVALHSRGPEWVSTQDGSAVNAAAVPGASVSHDNAVPELLLKTTATRGDGVFGKVTYVQRLATKGGLAPTGSCTAGAQVSSPYEATYTFYTAR